MLVFDAGRTDGIDARERREGLDALSTVYVRVKSGPMMNSTVNETECLSYAQPASVLHGKVRYGPVRYSTARVRVLTRGLVEVLANVQSNVLTFVHVLSLWSGPVRTVWLQVRFKSVRVSLSHQHAHSALDALLRALTRALLPAAAASVRAVRPAAPPVRHLPAAFTARRPPQDLCAPKVMYFKWTR